MDKESLKYVLTQATTRTLPDVTPRSLTLPLDSRKVVMLVGIRRSGKTYLLWQLGFSADGLPLGATS